MSGRHKPYFCIDIFLIEANAYESEVNDMENQTNTPSAPNAALTITLGVFRRLDNRFEGLPDDSPRGLELHNRRKEALHEVFDAERSVQVLRWGDTDDTRSHEYVELLIAAAASPAFKYVVVPGLKFLAQKLAEKAVDESASELVKAVFAWLRPPQAKKKILDFSMKLPDGTLVMVDPPDRDATIRIQFKDGKLESINYSQSSEGAPQPLASTG